MIASETFVVVFCPPKIAAHPKLSWWLWREGFQPGNVYWHRGIERRIHTVDYNQGVKAALESGKRELMFCDCDIEPSPAKTNAFLEDRFDLQCAKCPTECGGKSWTAPESWHTGMWRAKRETLEKLGMPLFGWPTSADGTELKGCMCVPLVEKARKLGITTGHLGEAGHELRGASDGRSLIIRT
jgi:hypothetical protein